MNRSDHFPKKVLCFGEPLVRMSPRVNAGWIYDHYMATYIGGAELNVASALARWSIPSKFVSALPSHSLSQDLVRYLQGKGIDTSAIRFSGDRIGVYFLPQGSDLKNADVIYDRAHSAFSELCPGQINWDLVLEDVSWVHLSAINPALCENIAAVCHELLKAAAERGITISLDLNYRSKLWKYGKKPSEVVPALAQYCDLVMGNLWAAEALLGIPLNKQQLKEGNKAAYIEESERISEAILHTYPKVKSIANTFRFDKAEHAIQYYATLRTPGRLYLSEEIHARAIKDKIGSGDCFMAGLIYGYYHQWSPDKIVNFSAAAAVGKMYETSDATAQTVESILSQTTINRIEE